MAVNNNKRTAGKRHGCWTGWFPAGLLGIIMIIAMIMMFVSIYGIVHASGFPHVNGPVPFGWVVLAMVTQLLILIIFLYGAIAFTAARTLGFVYEDIDAVKRDYQRQNRKVLVV